MASTSGSEFVVNSAAETSQNVDLVFVDEDEMPLTSLAIGTAYLERESVVSKNEEVCHKRQPRRRTTTVHTVHVSLIIFPRSHFPGCILLHKQPLS